ncbi:hypothetical protein PBRA_009305 [Plasmodiophora brassicae]|uniref:Uncharacterized protein n=1 Tax=Plasmodiophora brassicae TaxID=37360 RepID=A0A0G4J6B5_PLABS|nr:hypothetical protein PBRA_009305 [Plasmodiophora brassicae]
MRAAERPAPLSALFVVVPMALAIAFTIATTPTITYLAWYEAHVEFAALHNMLVDYVGLGDDLRLTPALVGEARRRVVNVVTARVGRKNNGASVERDPAHELFTAYVARARSKRWS